MPDYKIIITKTAQKQLDKLPDNIAAPLINTIALSANDPTPHGYKKLKGREGYRIRQGNYRVIYDIYDKVLTVEVIALGNRKDVYE